LRYLIPSQVAVEIRSGKGNDDWRVVVLAPEVNDGWIAAPGMQSDQEIISLTLVGLEN